MIYRQYWLPLASLVFSLGAAIYLYMLWSAPAPQWDVPMAAAALASDTPSVVLPPVLIPQREEFHDTLDRPVFSPSRQRPPPPAVVQQSIAPPVPTLTLVGTIIGPDVQVAMVKLPSSSTTQRFRQGQSIDGWEITQILKNRIILRFGTTEHEVNTPSLSNKSF